jgi:hypothetical protein
MLAACQTASISNLCHFLSPLGFLVSPTLIGFWVKSLRDKQQEHKKEADSEAGSEVGSGDFSI